MSFFVFFLVAWPSEDQDKGLLVRVEPLFQGNCSYEEQFWMKVIYKNVSGDTLFYNSSANDGAAADMWISRRLMDLVILNEAGRNVCGVPAVGLIAGLGSLGHDTPPSGWSRERMLKGGGYTILLPGDSLVKLMDLAWYTYGAPGVHTFDELMIDYTWDLGDWTGMWNGKIEVKNIGYKFILKKEKPPYYCQLIPQFNKTSTFAEAETELIKLLKKNPNTLVVYLGMKAAARIYAREKNISPDDSLAGIKEAIAQADAIEFLIQDLKAKGYDSEFFRADYWFWLYHYRRTHIGKLGGEK